MPFGVSFIVSLVAGLSILYFGFYQKKISAYQSFIAEATADKHIAPSKDFIIDESGIHRGESQNGMMIDESGVERGTGAEPIHQKETPSETTPGKNNPDTSVTPNKSADSKSPITTTPKNADQTDEIGAKSSGRRPKSPARPKRTPRPPSPKQRTSQITPQKDIPTNPPAESEDNPEINDGQQKDPVHIDDPQMEDNPIIRALKQASENQKDLPPEDRPPQTPRNPFEFLLKDDDSQ